MPLLRNKPLHIQPYFGFRSESRLHLQARALRIGSRNGGHSFEPAGRWRAMRTMLAQYASREVAGAQVSLHLTSPAGETITHEAVSDAEGFLNFSIDLKTGWALPETPLWEAAELRWNNREGEQTRTAHILAPGRQNALAVISDIDDTIIETGITGSITAIARNWRRIIAQWPEERIAVPGADVFFNALGGGQTGNAHHDADREAMAATGRPLFYVSSSPWNLFSYLVAFKRAKGLPLGPLLLRDWGLNRQTLGRSSHGGHKTAAIARILATFPDMRFALIGDDTQGDLHAFSDMAAQHEGRIAAIFIRRVAERALSEAELAAVAAIRQRDVPLWMGQSYSAGHEFLTSLGLEEDGDIASIVDAAANSSVPVKGAKR